MGLYFLLTLGSLPAFIGPGLLCYLKKTSLPPVKINKEGLIQRQLFGVR